MEVVNVVDDKCSGVIKPKDGGCGRTGKAIVRVQLETGANVFWCGKCITAFVGSKDDLRQATKRFGHTGL